MLGRGPEVARHRGWYEHAVEIELRRFRADLDELDVCLIGRVGQILDQPAGGVEDPQALRSHQTIVAGTPT